jgi:hypothetical protein
VVATSMRVVEGYAGALQDVIEGRAGADAALAEVWRTASEEVCGHA